MHSAPFYNSSYNGSYNGSYTVPTRFLQFLQKSHARAQPCKDLPPVLSFLLCPCDAQRRCGGDLLTTSLQSGDKTMPPEHMQNSLGYLCLRVQSGIPSRPERKKRPLCILPTHPLAVANRPLPCNVAGFGLLFSNKKGTIFSHRETCPQFGTAGNQHCIDWGCGGAARRGWRGRFFARDGLGCYGVALLCLCVRVWECCVEHGSCCLRLARLQARIWGRGDSMATQQELPMGATHSV